MGRARPLGMSFLRRIRYLVTVWLVAWLAVWPVVAHAGYVTGPTPAGFSGGVPLTYGGNALATFNWANGKVNGLLGPYRGGSFPFTAAAGSGASAALAAAARAGAWGIAGIGATWLLGYGLEYIAGQWQKKVLASGGFSASYQSFGTATGESKSAMCSALVAKINATNPVPPYFDNGVNGNNTCSIGRLFGVPPNQSTSYFESSQIANLGTPVSGYSPAVPADWVPVESTPPTSIPDNVLNDSRPTVAIPVADPVYGGSPLAIPTGAPQPVVGNPAFPSGWGQPQQWVTPSPATGTPWRLDDQWRLVPVPGASEGAPAPYSPGASAPTGVSPTPVTVVPGTSTETEEPTPFEMPCGVAGKPACLVKVDPEDTPVYSEPVVPHKPADLITEDGTKRNETAASVQAPTFGFIGAPPIAECTPFDYPQDSMGTQMGSVNPCGVVNTVRQIMGYIWALGAAWLSLGMIRKTITGGG